MSSILFSPDAAEEINKKIQEKIDKHLFLLCNYNPDSLKSYSYDAKFILGTMNMYKLLIDTGVCNKIGGIKKRYSLSFDYKRLEEIISIINSFRTYLGHNEDYRNGNEDDKAIVERWFSRLIGKKYPETADQYEKPLDEMTKYGEECVKLLNSFVEEVSKHTKRPEIITEWENLIFDFYKRPNSKNIIKGHIRLAYQARKGSASNYREGDIAMWTENMLFYAEQSKIDNLSNLAKGSSLPTKALKDISDKISENEALIRDKKREISTCLKKAESELKAFDYLDYYVSNFPERIIEEYKAGKLESLLPQDAVQQIIENDYSSTPV